MKAQAKGPTDSPLRIIVSGMVAGVPHHGGASWAVLQWVIGLQQLGHDVRLVEPISPGDLRPAGSSPSRSANATYFRSVMAQFGLERKAALLLAGTRRTLGLPYQDLLAFAYRADLLLNISGMLDDRLLFESVPRRVYVDLDPAFNQMWHAGGIDRQFAGHTHHVTVGLCVGQPETGSTVPTCGYDWIPTTPPVVLSHWPRAGQVIHEAVTTVANWRGYGSVDHDGIFYGQKAHSLRQVITLPQHSPERFLLALAIHADEKSDLDLLRDYGWDLVEPHAAAGTPGRYRRFIQSSRAELGLTKAGYVTSRCGWFSDRSACYLASGRPVVAQDTGFSRHLPTGEGLLTFDDVDSAAAAVDELRIDPERHAKAARALAEEHLDSNRVLSRLVSMVMS